MAPLNVPAISMCLVDFLSAMYHPKWAFSWAVLPGKKILCHIASATMARVHFSSQLILVKALTKQSIFFEDVSIESFHLIVVVTLALVEVSLKLIQNQEEVHLFLNTVAMDKTFATPWQSKIVWTKCADGWKRRFVKAGGFEQLDEMTSASIWNRQGLLLGAFHLAIVEMVNTWQLFGLFAKTEQIFKKNNNNGVHQLAWRNR